MSDPEKLPDMVMSWIDNGEAAEEIILRIRWFAGSLGAGLCLFLRETL